MNLIRLNVLPPVTGAEELGRLIITTTHTRIVKSIGASPWEVFLRPEHAPRLAIHVYCPKPSSSNQRRGK